MEALLLFFRTGLGKGILGAALLALLLAGAYAKGHSSGYDSGKKAGIESQKPEIARLAGIINTERTATALKTKKLEKDAADAALKSKDTQVAKVVTRTKIVDHYHETEKLVASQCGLSEASVDAINKMLNTQIIYDVPEVQPQPEPNREPDLN